MIQSMTGFGKASRQVDGKTIEAEIRSLNSKQLDLNIRLPYPYYTLEPEVRLLLSGLLKRGKIDLYVGFAGTSSKHKLTLNKDLAKNYMAELKLLAKELNEEEIDYLPLILKIPDVFKAEERTSEKEAAAILAVVQEAVEAVSKFRQQEGKALKKDIELHLSIVEDNDKKIDRLDSARIERLRAKLKSRIEEAMNGNTINMNRFEQEIVYFMEKFDINEERSRLKAHCSYFRKTLNEPAGGRKLGFIVQEIGREINTLGSKANDAEMQRLVVEMKDELEKVKEQLLNVL